MRNQRSPSRLYHFKWTETPFCSDDINATNKHGITRLWYAVCNDQDLGETKRLIEANANPSIGYLRGASLIEYAIEVHVPLEFIQLLIQYEVGFFVPHHNWATRSLLHLTIYDRNYHVFRYLLAQKEVHMFINSRDAQGFTPLDYAHGNIFFAERLMEEGAVQGKHVCSWHPFLVAKRKAVKETIVVLIGLIKRLYSRWMPLDMRRLLATAVHKTRFADPWYTMGQE